jgi:hypothetical protein
MTIPFATSNVAGVNLSQIDKPIATSDGYGQAVELGSGMALGTQVPASDGSVWVYCVYGTGGSTGLGYVCVIDEAWSAVMMSNSVGGLGDKIGVSPAVAIATDYGWIQVYGVCDDIRVAASAAANVALASTSTAGEIDDSVANPTKNLTGIILTTARTSSAGNAPGFLNWPVVGTTN